jgi:phytoene synthase
MPSANELRLAPGDLAACRRLLRDGSKSFFVASRLLPRQVRTAASIVYAFCRTADDAIDSGYATPDTVRELRQRLHRVYGGGAPQDAVERALQRVVRHYAIPRPLFEILLEGFAWELEGRACETLSDVYAYSVRVAATVGVAMTRIMGCGDAQTLARACDLGVAMQLTNIARDVGEDARAGRLYLPRRWMREAGIDPDQWLAAPRFSPALGGVVQRLLTAAEALYGRASLGIEQLPAECRPAIRAALLIYREIGRVIKRRGFDSVRSRAVTSAARKAWLALQSFASPTLDLAPTPGTDLLLEGEPLVRAGVAGSGFAPSRAPIPGPALAFAGTVYQESR